MIDNSMILTWTIYKIVSPSGKIYIGKTSNFEARMKAYKLKSALNQRLLYNSIKKYGFDAHIIIILEKFESNKDYSAGKEMFWIRSYMSNHCKWPQGSGLNLTDGGEGNVGFKPTAETRVRMSLAKKGRPPYNKGKFGQKPWNKGLKGVSNAWNKGIKNTHLTDEERKIKFGKHNIGNQYNKGKKHNPDDVKKMIENLKGRPIPKLYKPVIRFNKRGEIIGFYKSVQEASQRSRFSQFLVASICREETKKNNFMFKYKAA